MSAKLLEVFVKSVKGLLYSQKLSQTEFAQKLGVSRQTVSQFITGEHAPRLDKVEDIAKALDVPAFYLLMSEDERAIWDSKTKDNAAAIEERLAKLEYQLSALASKSPAPLPLGHSIPALEALAQEMQRVIGEPASEKHERKKGNG